MILLAIEVEKLCKEYDGIRTMKLCDYFAYDSDYFPYCKIFGNLNGNMNSKNVQPHPNCIKQRGGK